MLLLMMTLLIMTIQMLALVLVMAVMVMVMIVTSDSDCDIDHHDHCINILASTFPGLRLANGRLAMFAIIGMFFQDRRSCEGSRV